MRIFRQKPSPFAALTRKIIDCAWCLNRQSHSTEVPWWGDHTKYDADCLHQESTTSHLPETLRPITEVSPSGAHNVTVRTVDHSLRSTDAFALACPIAVPTPAEIAAHGSEKIVIGTLHRRV